MRRFSHLISYAPAGLLAIALVSTAADWRYLVETGGWFALLGNFMMVAATLVLLFLAAVLALFLAALPFIYLFCRNEDDFFALAEASPGVVILLRGEHEAREKTGFGDSDYTPPGAYVPPVLQPTFLRARAPVPQKNRQIDRVDDKITVGVGELAAGVETRAPQSQHDRKIIRVHLDSGIRLGSSRRGSRPTFRSA